MNKRTIMAAVMALASALPTVHGLSKSNDILDYYRLLVREKKIADVLENKNGQWIARSLFEGERKESKESPIVDQKNGYISAVYEGGPCKTRLDLAYFISADKRNFIAVS